MKITMEVDKLPKNFTGVAEWNDGYKEWFVNGKCHREDGPAIIYPNGDKRWYLNDIGYSEARYNKEMKKRKNSRNGKVVEIYGKKYKLVEIN